MEKTKNFEFEGIDAKTEWRIALLIAFPALSTFCTVMYLFESSIMKASFMLQFSLASSLTLVMSMLLLKLLSMSIKNKKWNINTYENKIEIVHKNKKKVILLMDIKCIKNLGNIGFRYLTIQSAYETIKIRVGNTGFVPFSAQQDIESVDAFIEYLSPFLTKEFNKKVLKNKMTTYMFPNYGVYVTKSEKIKYSVINKLKPWQIILIFLSVGFFLLILLFTQLEKYW